MPERREDWKTPLYRLLSPRLRKLSICAPSPASSVNGLQDRLRLRVLQHVVPQKIILPGTRLVEPILAVERQIAVSIQASRYPQGITRQLSLKAIFTADIEWTVRMRSHVEATVTQGIKLPVSAVIVFGNVARDCIHKRF